MARRVFIAAACALTAVVICAPNPRWSTTASAPQHVVSAATSAAP